MKLYIKDGKISYPNKIVLEVGNRSIYNPSEKDLIANGWEVYKKQEEEITITLEVAKENKIQEIQLFDKSEEINQFYIEEDALWFDKNERAGLIMRFRAEQESESINTVIWYNGKQYPMTVTDAIQILNSVEIYAAQCFDNTQRHIAAINQLNKIEEVESYDYYVGYPEKLRF